MVSSLKPEELQKTYYILKGMVVKNFKGKYGGSFLGLWWTLLEPLLLIASVGFVFNYVFKVPIVKFPVFLLSGILPWVYFSAVLNDAMVSVVVNAPSVKQFNFAKIIFPFSHVLSSLTGLLAGFVFLIPFFIWVNGDVLGQLFYILPLLFCFVMLTLGLSLVLSVVYIFFRDILYIFHSFLMIWFWLTPIFYEVSMIPKKFRLLSYLNPLTAFMECFRAVFYYGKAPGGFELMAAFLSAVLFLFLGVIVFILSDKKIIKKI